jgi:MbtH protein
MRLASKMASFAVCFLTVGKPECGLAGEPPVSPSDARELGGYAMAEDEEDTRIYKVVVNHEEQYSIWLNDKAIPMGWRAVGKEGPKKECLAYIEEVWTDMRPLSLRKAMAERSSS